MTKLGARLFGGVGYLQPRGHVLSSSSSSIILQHLKVLHLRVSFSNLQINTLTTVNFSAVVYTIFVFNTHPINRISKARAAIIVNTISSYDVVLQKQKFQERSRILLKCI